MSDVINFPPTLVKDEHVVFRESYLMLRDSLQQLQNLVSETKSFTEGVAFMTKENCLPIDRIFSKVSRVNALLQQFIQDFELSAVIEQEKKEFLRDPLDEKMEIKIKKALFEKAVDDHISNIKLTDSVVKLLLSSFTFAALQSNGVNLIQDLIALTEQELLQLPRIGQNRINEIKAQLSAHHLKLKES